MKRNNQLSKQELLEKLTEISEQLEGLEKSLDSSLSAHRKSMLKEQTSRLDECERKIAAIEEQYFARRINITDTKKAILQKMKLELGF